MIPVLLGVAALCAVLAVLLVAALVHLGRRGPEPPQPSSTPLYDLTADALGIRPETPFTCGDETDIIQALRVANDRPVLRVVSR